MNPEQFTKLIEAKNVYTVALIFCLGMFSLTLPLPTTANVLQNPLPTLNIEVIPTTILRTAKNNQVQVVVRNPTNNTVSNLSLSWLNNTSLKISSDKKTIDQLPPNAEVAWTLNISQTYQTQNAEKIYLRIDYSWIDNTSSAKPIPRVQFSELQVTVPPFESIDTIASIEVKSVLTDVNEHSPGFVYIILENKSNIPIQITDATHLKLVDVITVSPEETIKDVTLLPHQKRNILYTVAVSNTVRPSKYILPFEIDLSWQKDGQEQVGTLITMHEVKVGVFGESQILDLLGIPAFFLLPGYLMMLAFQILWERGKTSEEGEKFPSPKSSKFLFMAISLSSLMAVLYPQATRLLIGVRRDYLYGYGLVDIFYVWYGSILLSAGSYVTYYGMIKPLYSKYIQNQIAKKTHIEGETPKDTLSKLANRKLTMKQKKVKINIDDKVYYAFKLQEKTNEPDTYLVAPRIFITNSLDESTGRRIDEIIEKDDINAFLKFYPKLELAWSKEDNWVQSPVPRMVKQAQIENSGEPAIMVMNCRN